MSLPTISLEKRKTTFDEVNIGFTKEQAIEEANRCLQCKNPKCVQGCPANVLIPDFIKAFREGDIEKAAKIIRIKNRFPSICGRICQHEKQCEGNCIFAPAGKAIAIGGLERYIGDNATYPKKKKTNGKKIAVIGSGPSGLTVAANLSLKGFNVTVFERTHALGGVIKYGVPEFRLPKEVVGKELRALHNLGIDFEPDAKISDEYIKKIAKEFDAVFLGTGVGFARKLEVEGSQLKGIIPAMKFLVHLNQSDMPLINENDNVVVVGAGYVGIDAARSAIRLGAKKVSCITVSSREDAEKGVSKKDYREAEEEGVEFLFGLTVDKFESKDGEKVSLVHYKNGIDGIIKADKVIVAIGQIQDEDDFKQPLRDKKNGMVKVNSNHKTRMKNVFAAGDCVHGPKTVIQAIAMGRDAAKEMYEFLETKEINNTV
ncbi:MAG: FAD-dependent oxidoreductase [archaeon]|jgi:glutamate synthase (NADPH/NADH) small chain